MKKIICIFILMLLIGTVVSHVSACTGFTYSDGENVLVGSNFDWYDYNVNIRFFPPTDDKYGTMFFEIPTLLPDGNISLYTMSGMNDQGLWHDFYFTPYLLPVNSSNKPIYTNPDLYYKDNIAEYCFSKFSTINELFNYVISYNLVQLYEGQIFIVEETGNSIICEGDNWIYKEGDFQVVSNFLHSHPELGDRANGFLRYNIAVSMLENMTDLSVDYFTDICNATHMEERSIWTIFSWICDLKNQIVYLYHFYDYENVVVIDLKEELEKGEHSIYIGSLFEPDGNKGPIKPEIPKGNESGSTGEEYRYSVRKIEDPDGDLLSYKWDWGDGTSSCWTPAPTSGIYFSENHIWSEEGTYEVRVKLRDIYGAESEWSDPLIVNMPKNKSLSEFNPWLLRLIQRFPILKLLL
jgi:hypothetical protein